MTVSGAGVVVFTLSADDELWLRNLAWSMKRHVSHSIQIDDLLQEGRIAVWQVRAKDPSAPTSYLYTRARYNMLDFVRTQAWGPRGCDSSVWEMQSVDGWRTLDDDSRSAYEDIPHSDNPEALACLKQAFFKAYACMKPQVQEAFDLLLQGHTVEEMANYFDVSPSRISHLMVAARATLDQFTNGKTPSASAEEQTVAGVNQWISDLQARVAGESAVARRTLNTAAGK
jgi:RNA polymerase sigma factor (sigma-70 family)